MATISSAGLGSGLDVDSLVSQLMVIERKPLTALQTRQSGINGKISALGTVKSLIDSLQTSAKAINTASTFTALQATVADTSVASATVTSTATAASYTLEVTQLAKSQVLHTAQNPGIVAGTLSIAVAGGAATDVAVVAGDTPSTLAAKINADATLKTKIKASVIDSRLVLESLSTGLVNTITVNGVAADLGTGLDAFDTANLTQARPPQDAIVKLNGMSVTRSSNTISDAVTGLTLTLTKENIGTPTTLTVGRSSAALVSNLEGFVKAFNEVNSTLRRLTAYDPTSKTSAVLTGDSTASSAQAQLRRALNTVPTALAGASYKQLSQLGITTQTDGSLKFDSAKLKTVFDSNSTEVAQAAAAYGSAVELASKQLAATGGLLATRVSGLGTSATSMTKQAANMEYRLTQTEKRLRAQFSSLDTLVSSMSKTSSFLSQQLANLPKAG